MKRAAKSKAKGGAKRDLFAELSKGMEALADARQGKRTLRTHAVEYKPVPQVTPQDLIRVRKSLRISRALFAALSADERTHTGKLGTRARQAKRASRPTNQSRQALPGHSPKTRFHLILNIAESQAREIG